MHYLDQIILALDAYMERVGKNTLSPPEANEHLNSIGLLPNYDRSGSELRKLCRNGAIRTALQPGGRGTKWVIYHSKNIKFKKAEKLEDIVSLGKGEREVSAFLAKHPQILRWAVCKTGGHCTYVLREFPFGSHYKADFVVVMCYSGAWEVHLIELEPTDDAVITKDGKPSNRLNGALLQLRDWKEYIDRNSLAFRQDLSSWCQKKDILGDCKTVKTPVNGTGHYLKDAETFIYFNYYIFIGDRKKITDDQRRRINQLNGDDYRTKIFTYGRLIDIAKNMDDFSAGVRWVETTKSQE